MKAQSKTPSQASPCLFDPEAKGKELCATGQSRDSGAQEPAV